MNQIGDACIGTIVYNILVRFNFDLCYLIISKLVSVGN